MSTLEMIRFVKECFPEYRGQLFMNMSDTGRLFGVGRAQLREFIIRQGIPFYRPAKEKLYNVIEVFEAIQRTRNQDTRTG